jgi:hypothetical protein
MESAGASFQDELAKITEEIRVSRTPNPTSTSALEARLTALSQTHTTTMMGLYSKFDTLQKDALTSLQVSESRYKKLDEQFKDTSAENELLYARFNEELSNMMGQIRRGDGVEELRRRLAESLEENARLKKENSRLRRENGGLKAQLRE